MARILKGLSQDGGGWTFLKTSTPLSLINTYRVNLISPRSISLDSTFKRGKIIFKKDMQYMRILNRMDAARNGANLVKIPFSTFSNFQG
jgi:hypothetical protein